MVLNPAQGIRFFQLLDSVVDFANARLGLNLRVGCDRAQRDPEKQSEVMRALCAPRGSAGICRAEPVGLFGVASEGCGIVVRGAR